MHEKILGDIIDEVQHKFDCVNYMDDQVRAVEKALAGTGLTAEVDGIMFAQTTASRAWRIYVLMMNVEEGDMWMDWSGLSSDAKVEAYSKIPLLLAKLREVARKRGEEAVAAFELTGILFDGIGCRDGIVSALIAVGVLFNALESGYTTDRVIALNAFREAYDNAMAIPVVRDGIAACYKELEGGE